MGKRLIGSVGLAGVPDDLLTTKGDTHGFSSTNARIPIGDDDQVLTADSSEALGLKWAAAGGGATVSHQTMAITSNETTESATVTDTGLVLTMPTSDQMFFFGGQGSLLNDSGNTIYIQIQDASTDQPRQSAGVGTSDRVWFCLNYAGDCDGQEIRVRWSTDGGDSEATLYGTAGTSSGDAQASCQSLEVG